MKIKNRQITCISMLILTTIFFIRPVVASPRQDVKYHHIVNEVIKPLVKKYRIPGVAVGLTIHGKEYFYNYGVASLKTKKTITKNTLFEIGSITKTLTATVLAKLINRHQLALDQVVAQYIPQLKTSPIAKATLLELATHTSGLPMLAPAKVKTKKQLYQYLKTIQLNGPIGKNRQYSNIGIGLLGFILENSIVTPAF